MLLPLTFFYSTTSVQIHENTTLVLNDHDTNKAYYPRFITFNTLNGLSAMEKQKTDITAANQPEATESDYGTIVSQCEQPRFLSLKFLSITTFQTFGRD